MGAGVVDGLPPGPDQKEWVQALRWALRPTALLRECEREFGEIFTLRGLVRTDGFPYVFVSNPEAIKAIATGDRDALRAGAARGSDLFEPVFGPSSILLLDGAKHLRQRKLLLPPFHGERMKRYGELITSETERRMAAWPRGGEPFELQAEFQEITLDVILRAVFGFDTGPAFAEARRHIKRWLELLASPAAMVPWLRINFGPGKPWSPLARIRDRIDESLYALIRERRADPAVAERDDVLSMLVGARDEDGQPMTDQELRDELITLLLAGHETTATAMAWAVELLLAHPDKLAALRADLPNGDEYLDAVIHETMRLRPPLPLFDRLVCEPVEVLGYRIPAGSVMACNIVSAHRRPDDLPGAARVPARALPRQRAGDLRVDPVRRRRAALPRRGVRAVRDADRAADGRRADRAPRGRPAAVALLPPRDRPRPALAGPRRAARVATGRGPRRGGRTSAAAPGPSSSVTKRSRPRDDDGGLRASPCGGRGRPPRRPGRRRRSTSPCSSRPCGSWRPRQSSSGARPATPIATSAWPWRHARPNESAMTTAARAPSAARRRRALRVGVLGEEDERAAARRSRRRRRRSRRRSRGGCGR